MFGTEIDYAQLVKTYGATPEGPETRYSPAQYMGAQGSHQRQPGSSARLNEFHGAAESHDAHVNAAIHLVDEWFLKEA